MTVGGCIGGVPQHQLIARQFPVRPNPWPNQPHQRIEPVHRLQHRPPAIDEHIPPPQVCAFVHEHIMQFIGRKRLSEPARQQQAWPEDPGDRRSFHSVCQPKFRPASQVQRQPRVFQRLQQLPVAGQLSPAHDAPEREACDGQAQKEDSRHDAIGGRENCRH